MLKTIGAGLRIKEWREGNSLSEQDLCDVLKISKATLLDIETEEKDPIYEIFIMFARHTNIDLHWMLTGEWQKKGYTQGIH